MTEEDWLTATDPQPMLAHLGAQASDRKLRLFAVACCRMISKLLDTRGLTALDIADQYADGLVSDDQLSNAERLAEDAFNEFSHVREYAAEVVMAACGLDDLEENTSRVAWLTVQLVDVGVARPLINATRRLTQRQECRWLRDMFNPFHPVAFFPDWHTSDVILLANGIYAERAFDRMPILADALQDAGCDSDDLLNHLRDPSAAHVRGCWALDMVLGRE